MTIIWGPLFPPAAATYGGSTGDIWVSLANNQQQRFNAGPPPAWTPIVPPDTRGDVVPPAGVLNDRLAKLGANPANSWSLGWANAADGVVAQFESTDPGVIADGDATQWILTHNLGFQFIDVSVISPGNRNPGAPQTVEVPIIDFESQMRCRLRFAEPVAGTAIVRR